MNIQTGNGLRGRGERRVDMGELVVTAVWTEAANLVTAVGAVLEDQFAAEPDSSLPLSPQPNARTDAARARRRLAWEVNTTNPAARGRARPNGMSVRSTGANGFLVETPPDWGFLSLSLSSNT